MIINIIISHADLVVYIYTAKYALIPSRGRGEEGNICWRHLGGNMKKGEGNR
jgi:hypothetical protein